MAKIKVIGLLICLSSILFGADQELLQTQDINKVMRQILDQHVDKKEISMSIIKNSFAVYINQFDPERIYLLASETRPFIDMEESTVSTVLNEYRQGKFTKYEELNQLIAKAIRRAQVFRETVLKKELIQLLAKSRSYTSDGYEDWSDPNLKQAFPVTTQELDDRVRHKFVHFIAMENTRYGINMDRMDQIWKIFDRDARIHENQYLFINDSGKPMNDKEKQNTFSLHILKALASSLDAHTTVLSSIEASDMKIRLEKEISGIGIEFSPDQNGAFIIHHLVEGGPAEKNGDIKVDDQVVQVDGVTIKGKSMSEVLNMIRGKAKSKVTLVLSRAINPLSPQERQNVSVSLQREEIPSNEDRLQTAYEKINRGGIIGIIKLDSFYQSDLGISSEEDMINAIKAFKKQGDLRGLILDFRENGGGFLAQAVKIVGLFITDGVVVISQYFNGEKHFYRDIDKKIIYNGPLVILTSKATASAAEIVAQALQDYGVAVIVGDERTYGKGTIQSQTVTDNQGSTFFKVTVGKYYTVSGKTPQIQGVKADIVVPSQFLHEKLGEEYLENSLKPDTIASAYDDQLDDVPANLKSWYMRYYLPQLQHKKVFWERFLPALKRNSASRISRNPRYQAFIKQAILPETQGRGDDLPLNEALNIVKDMIFLETQDRFDVKPAEGILQEQPMLQT